MTRFNVARSFVLRLFVLLLLPGCLLGEPSSKGTEIPVSLMAKTVAWQVHWDEQASGTTNKAPSVLTFKTNTNAEVWVDELEWIISFDDRNGEVFPYHVEHTAGTEKRGALSAFARIAKVAARLPAYTNSFYKISIIKAEVRERLLQALKHEACSDKDLAFYRTQTGKSDGRIRVWVAPVDPDFPVLLYAVEGVPYVGKVYFGTHTFRPLYSEFNYITDPGSEAHDQGLKLINAIKAEGTAFELKDGQLMPAG